MCVPACIRVCPCSGACDMAGDGLCSLPQPPLGKKNAPSQNGEQGTCTDRASQPLPRVVPGTVPTGWVTWAGLRMQLGTPPRAPLPRALRGPSEQGLERGNLHLLGAPGATFLAAFPLEEPPGWMLSPWGCSGPPGHVFLAAGAERTCCCEQTNTSRAKRWRRKRPARPARVKLWAPAGQGL